MLPREDYIPSIEELTVPEAKVSSIVLKAASLYMGKYCDNQYKEYALCKSEHGDPRPCLNEGKEVTRCSIDFLRNVKKTCNEDFTAFWNCLDHSLDQKYKYCRKYEQKLDVCMAEKLNVLRPEPGFYSKIRIHDTDRPKPVREPSRPQLETPAPYEGRVPKAPAYPAGGI
ncbi:NADH dehydrogenase [ubiquinone] 1 alpha subcomplex subunit 8-like [Dreissena polymorpha]|uniref:NADH dehydrogenase [ubiquinone] 1 alpha subcomplex subunit 8 n=1 Tax=Dreissena polymorpha TaxID=45954 RepID=A0A9D4BLN6_DREPO|nr:NADH dehydrogenase [ubiquinone] 1 alpha subcomplex subunit 8-like [Dreissena polymorpha]KAH3700624.1 hypothetical protein DPMN_075601 [Dreissena polymorpha]